MSLNLQLQSGFTAKTWHSPEWLDACPSTLPLVTTLVIGYLRRKKEVSSKPNPDCSGFGRSGQ